MKRPAVYIWAILGALLIGGPGMRAARPVDQAAVWTQLGPTGGNIMGIARNLKSPSELYAVSERGLVYRSVNNGKSWTLKSILGDYAYDFVLDPKNPRTIYILASDGLYKSVDQGSTFTKLPFGQYRQGYSGRIAINPQNPKVIFVAGSYTYDTSSWKTCLAVFMTTNGGQTWSHKTMEATSSYAYGRDIAISPKNPSTIFFCGYFYDGSNYRARVFRSTNGGGAWKNVTPAFMNDLHTIVNYAYTVAIDPSNPSRILVSYQNTVAGVAISANSGTTWKKQNSPSYIAYLESLAFEQGPSQHRVRRRVQGSLEEHERRNGLDQMRDRLRRTRVEGLDLGKHGSRLRDGGGL